jgi:hypothetical protein
VTFKVGTFKGADSRIAGVKASLKKGLTDYMRTTDDPRAAGRGEVFARYPIWSGGRTQMGGYNRSGQLELFDKSKYAQWMKENVSAIQNGDEGGGE